MLQTQRLLLVPATTALIDAELAGGSGALVRALGTSTPEAWPPELYERDDLERLRKVLEDPANAGWGVYYVIERTESPALIGIAGFGGGPNDEGVVQLGYSILPSARRRGFATEAVAALLEHALTHARVKVVVAETYSTLPASLGVLQKCGFCQVASRPGSETLRYEFARDRATSRASC
jgi:RimJ/RimL family protein N-acetyltransferase